MSLATLKTKVEKLIEKAQNGGGIDELEAIIDNSGVLDSTDGTVTDKVEQLIAFRDLFGKITAISNMSKTTRESIDFYIDFPYLNTVIDFLRDNKTVKRIVGINTANVVSISRMFVNSVIETIERPFNFSLINRAIDSFNSAASLRDVSFVAETIKVSIAFSSPVLSDESIQSIFDGLATVTTAQTLTLNANLKILQSQVDAANAKGWTVAGGTVVSEEEYYG
jgi:hypothetical protein